MKKRNEFTMSKIYNSLSATAFGLRPRKFSNASDTDCDKFMINETNKQTNKRNWKTKKNKTKNSNLAYLLYI